MVRVVVADGQSLVREGIKSILSQRPGLRVVGEAAEAAELLGLLPEARPEVVLLDLHLPGGNGLSLVPEIRRRVGSSRVIVLGAYGWAEGFAEIFRAGARGYLPKAVTAAELLYAVEAVGRGETYLAMPRNGREADTVASTVEEPLTQREREVLELIAAGETVRAVAERLSVSSRTVQTHLTHVMGKAGVHNRAELVRYAIRRGVLRLD